MAGSFGYAMKGVSQYRQAVGLKSMHDDAPANPDHGGGSDNGEPA